MKEKEKEKNSIGT